MNAFNSILCQRMHLSPPEAGRDTIHSGKEYQLRGDQMLVFFGTTVGSLALPVRTVRSEKLAYLSATM